MRTARVGRSRSAREEGFTLVELLVAIVMLSLLSTIVLSSVLALARGVDAAQGTSDLSAEARTALERISRELRQADSLTVAQPQGMTVEVDFDGDGSIHGSLADPEVVSYGYDSATQSLSLTATVPGESSATKPLLAGHVSALSFSYTSSDWSKDANHDGTVTVTEAGIAGLDRVQINLTVTNSGTSQTYRTQVALRNRSQS